MFIDIVYSSVIALIGVISIVVCFLDQKSSRLSIVLVTIISYTVFFTLAYVYKLPDHVLSLSLPF